MEPLDVFNPEVSDSTKSILTSIREIMQMCVNRLSKAFELWMLTTLSDLPTMLSTDDRCLQVCCCPIHNASDRALATWLWLGALLGQENPGDHKPSWLRTTVLTCSVVVLSSFWIWMCDSTHPCRPRAHSTRSSCLSISNSFHSLVLCSSQWFAVPSSYYWSTLSEWSLPFGRFQWELEPWQLPPLGANFSNSHQHKNFFWLFPQPLVRSEHDCPLQFSRVHN